MAGHRSLEQERSVYVTTSLDTRLACPVHLSDTVSDLKKKLILEHLSCFPSFGEIKIHAVKVKLKGCFYHLPDSMLLSTVFTGRNYWYLYVDVSTSTVYLEEIIHQNGPFNCDAHVLQRGVLKVEKDNEGGESAIGDHLIVASSADGASDVRKKLKLHQGLKCHKQEEPALHQTAKGSRGQHDQALGADAHYGSEVQNGPALFFQGENDSQFLGDDSQVIGDEVISGTEKIHVANDLLASGVVVDESSKKKKKSDNKPSKMGNVYPEKKLGLKQDSKEKLVRMQAEASVGANSPAETKEADNKEKNVKEKSADVVVVHEKSFDDNAGHGVQEENTELFHGDEANDEAEKVIFSPDLLASGVVEDESSKKKTKKSTNKRSKKKTVHLEEKVASKQDPKGKVLPQHVEDSTGANSLTKVKEADNKEKCVKENSADVVVVHEQTFDTDGDKLQEENHKQFHGDEATGEVEKVNLAPDLVVSGMVKDTSSPKKKKPAQKINATPKKPIDSLEDHQLENIESSLVVSSLARPRELAISKNDCSQTKGNESVTPISYEKTADGLSAEVNSQETSKRKGMTGAVQEAPRKGKRKQSATDKSVEQEGDINASSEMTKKEGRKFSSASDVSKSDNLLSCASSFHASDGKLEESGRIIFRDYFSPLRPQVIVAASADTDEVARMKGNDKINPSNLRKNSSNQSLLASVEGRKRNMLDKSGSIFEDDSSGGPDDDQGSGKSYFTMRTPYDNSVSSDYFDDDSYALMKSPENGNDSHQNDRYSNMKNLLSFNSSSSGKDVELTKILQRSSMYKMAKKAASQSTLFREARQMSSRSQLGLE